MTGQFAQAALFLWLPIVVAIFVFLPPRRAVVASFVIAWLTLPNIGLPIPGLPNYTKMTATIVGVLLCTGIFDASRFTSFKFQRYDWPMVVWCVAPFITAFFNDLGPYEGLSAVLDQLAWWGLPYLIGRLYLTDLESLRELSLGIFLGGLAYVIPCWIEITMSPVLETWVYGKLGTHFADIRYGGYRPRVFLATGLELGLWMAISSFLGYQLWACGAVKKIKGVPMIILLPILIGTTVACKSTGAVGLLILGVGVSWLMKRTAKTALIWLLLLFPAWYSVARTTNLWSGYRILGFVTTVFGADRAESLGYRFFNEDMLAERAMQRPIWGWGRFGRNLVDNDLGETATIPDGYWIIVLGTNGSIGLVTLLTFMLLPMYLTMRRFKGVSWRDPQVAPAMGVAFALVMLMMDFLSNAMLNPIYAVMVGGVMGQSAVRLSHGRQEAEGNLEHAAELMSQGHAAEAAREFDRTILFVSEGDDIAGRQIQAKALDGLGHSRRALGQYAEAEEAFHDALMVRDWLAAHAPDASRFQDLAIARESLARLFAETGRTVEAVAERQIALKTWDLLVQEHPKNAEYRAHRIEALNDLAWMLATDPDPRVYQPDLAVILAEEAVKAGGQLDAAWNTLGVARYRAGDWAGAIEALEKSALREGNGGSSYDHYFLSMAWSRLQHEDHAREWLERGNAWASRNRPGHPTLERFRDEAETLLATGV
jgi:tetratricopeptide (TPR) repeat protein